MTILIAKFARVKNVVGCTPPISGKLPNATIAAIHLAGANEINIVVGVQVIVAMAIDTETIHIVNFFAGPGNGFVAEGKRQLFGEVGIDLFAGPTEILIVLIRRPILSQLQLIFSHRLNMDLTCLPFLSQHRRM